LDLSDPGIEKTPWAARDCLFNLKASEETFYDVIACLAEGNGIRATAWIKKVDRDTVATWLDKASQGKRFDIMADLG
jgi:transposase-like protein